MKEFQPQNKTIPNRQFLEKVNKINSKCHCAYTKPYYNTTGMNTLTKTNTQEKFSSIKDRLDAQLAKAEAALREVEALGVELKQFENKN